MPPRRRREPAAGRGRVPPRLPTGLRSATPDDDLMDEGLVSTVHFQGTDLSGRTARLVDVEGCRFDDCRLADGRLDRIGFVDVVLARCDLANLRLEHAALTRVELVGCRATGLALGGAIVRNVAFRDCLADFSVFRFASLANTTLVDCRLQSADFVGADLSGAVFRNCDLTRAELSQVKAAGAVFVDCVWDGVRGITSLAGATVVHGSPLDSHAFMVATAGGLGIKLGDPDDFLPDDPAVLAP